MGVAALPVEGREVLGQEPPLALAVATGRDHEHVVADGFSKSVDHAGHGW
jgi:hypothetical protein